MMMIMMLLGLKRHGIVQAGTYVLPSVRSVRFIKLWKARHDDPVDNAERRFVDMASLGARSEHWRQRARARLIRDNGENKTSLLVTLVRRRPEESTGTNSAAHLHRGGSIAVSGATVVLVSSCSSAAKSAIISRV